MPPVRVLLGVCLAVTTGACVRPNLGRPDGEAPADGQPDVAADAPDAAVAPQASAMDAAAESIAAVAEAGAAE